MTNLYNEQTALKLIICSFEHFLRVHGLSGLSSPEADMFIFLIEFLAQNLRVKVDASCDKASVSLLKNLEDAIRMIHFLKKS